MNRNSLKLLAAVILLVGIFASVPAQPEASSAEGLAFKSGMQLLEECQSADADVQLACMQYIVGVIDGANWALNDRIMGHGWCFPSGTSGVHPPQLRLVVLRYLENHPEDLHYNAVSEIVAALHGAFPCTPNR
jgi:hypothetical protein